VVLPSPVWHDGYAAVVEGTPDLSQRTAEAGLSVVKTMLDPILAGSVTGAWDSDALLWIETEAES